MAFDSDGEVEGSISIFAAPKRKRAESEIVASQPDQSVEKSIEDGESKQVRSFTDLGMDPWACRILSGLSITSPTAVQANCIPEILAGQEVVAAAKTGSGKTAAFALPILHMLSRDPHGFFALVLTPTRELALQIAEQFSIFGKPINATICVAVGGMDMTTQALELTRRPHIIVATPGRLADLLESGQIKFDHLRYLVFDEADRLLASDASFLQREIPLILERITSNKVAWQFFSATMSADVFEFQKLHRQSRPFSFDGNTEFGTVSHLDQRFILVPSQVRDANLVNLLRGKFAGMSIIIFTGKCKNCELLLQTLLQLKIQAVALHSKMPQRQRLASLNKFKSGSVRILISTDVGSRGLDIPIVDAVINFDLPADARDYVHRVGRAARAGKPGMALSFVQELDLDIWSSIEAKIDKKIPLYQFAPLESDVVAILNEVTAAKREAGMILHDRKFGAKAEHNKKKLKS